MKRLLLCLILAGALAAAEPWPATSIPGEPPAAVLIDAYPRLIARTGALPRRAKLRHARQLWAILHPAARWYVPAWWLRAGAGVAWCESRGNPRAVSAGGHYRGKWQFDWGTWASVGGSGDPAAASEREQDHRAYRLWQSRGWAPWPVCGRLAGG